MKKMTIAVILLGLMTALAGTGCTAGSKQTVSPGDTAVSSVEETEPVDVTQAVEVRIGQETDNEIFILEYHWYGKQFISEDSLNKTMLDNYAPKNHRAPDAPQDAAISFRFDASQKEPKVIQLTQFGNTVRADSGLPYDTQTVDLTNNGDNTFCFILDYREFTMYYYLLECEWENGNRLKIAFAVEKPKD